MRIAQSMLTMCVVFALSGCTFSAPSTNAETCAQDAPAAADAPKSAMERRLAALQIENDKACRSMHGGLPCSALVHMLGPVNAELQNADRACVRETISAYRDGKWVADNKYQHPTTGERFGDHCIAISL